MKNKERIWILENRVSSLERTVETQKKILDTIMKFQTVSADGVKNMSGITDLEVKVMPGVKCFF